MPRVSVIIPTYNRKDYVQEAIDSVLAQTYTDYEIIVVDDGSTDGTGEALQARYGDRIRYVWQENQGESVARNRGIEMAQGEFIATLDSDDLWLPRKLEKQVAHLMEHVETGAVICQGQAIDEQGHILPDVEVLGARTTAEDLTLDALLSINTISAPSTMLVGRRSVFMSSGGYDPAIRYGEDWDFCIRLRAKAYIDQVAEVLCLIRYHRDSQWRLKTWDKIEPTLNDRLRTFAKGFSLVPSTEKYRDMRAKAESREYMDAALAALAWGKYDIGAQWLAQAVAIAPTPWWEPAQLGGAFAHSFIEVQERTKRLAPNDLSQALSQTWSALAKASFDNRFRKAFKQQVFAALFFDAVRVNDRDIIRWLMPRLLFISPQWARNRGVWSKGIDAYLGQARSSHLKRLIKAVLHIDQMAE